MTPKGAGSQPHGTLEQLVRKLEREAGVFEPARRRRSEQLPGRDPGNHLQEIRERSAGAGMVVLDCGISRRNGFTHVLWVSASAESIMGSHAFSRLADAVAAINGVTGYEWEGFDRLHVRAPGIDWDEMLADARHAVVMLAPQCA